MTRLAVVAMLMAACAAPRESPTTPVRTKPLHEVQAICRGRDMTSIGYQANRISLQCNGAKATDVALAFYDVGTAAGISEGESIYADMTTLCLCKRGGCGQEFYDTTYRGLRRKFDAIKSGEAEGRYMGEATVPRRSCVDSTIAAELVQAGFQCSFAAGQTSRTFREHRLDTIMSVEKVDRAEAELIADSCIQ